MVRTATRPLTIIAIVLILAGCGPDLQDVPDFAALGFADAQQPVRQQMATVYQQWQEQPKNPNRNGRLGMHLAVYGKNTAAETLYERARALAPREFRWAYYLAFTLREMGRYDEAVAMFHEALKVKPDHVEARLQLAELLMQGNQLEQSLQLYQAITQEFPGRIEGWLGLGKVHSRLDDYESALTALRRARLMGPQYGEIRFALAQALRAIGDHSGAVLEFAGAERMAINKIKMADPLLAAISALHAGDEPHLDRANSLLRSAQVDVQFMQAATSFRAALAINSANPEAWIGLLSSLAAADNIEAADTTYRDALDADISYARLELTYGRILLERGRLDEAEKIIRRAIDLDPQYAEAYTALGQLELQRDAGADAVEQFQLSLTAKPNDPLVRLWLVQALNLAGQHTEAIEQLTNIADNPMLDESLVIKELAIANYGNGYKSEAIKILQQAGDATSNASQRQIIDALLADWQ